MNLRAGDERSSSGRGVAAVGVTGEVGCSFTSSSLSSGVGDATCTRCWAGAENHRHANIQISSVCGALCKSIHDSVDSDITHEKCKALK